MAGLAVAVVGSILTVAIVASGGSGRTAKVRAFNACIHRTRFLVLTRRASRGRIVETIRDRAGMMIEGKFAMLPSAHAAVSFARTLTFGGSGVINGRMVLLTTANAGRDASTIQTCGGPDFPGP